MRLGIDIWARCGVKASAADLFKITEILGEIDARIEEAGFSDGAFHGSKVVLLSWCSSQEWFRRAVHARKEELEKRSARMSAFGADR